MKRGISFAAALLLLMMAAQTALAAKARGIATDADSTWHAEHLSAHLNAGDCRATGNYIKVHADGEWSKIVGHLEQADAFRLIEVRNGYALIQVTAADATSPDSRAGMTGWVDADYIDCTCDAQAYRSAAISAAPAQTAGLEGLIGTTDAVCTGNNLRVRNAPGGADILGHLEKADQFLLLGIQDGWAQIQVTRAAETSPDSWAGLTGWVSADYLSAGSGTGMAAGTGTVVDPQNWTVTDTWGGYGDVLEMFYTVIVEQWDIEKKWSLGFTEPYDIPSSLDSGFILRDLNADGIDELIVLGKGYFSNSMDAYLTAIYTIRDGRPVMALESWTRSRNYLRADGSIYGEGSNGAAYAVYEILDLIGTEFVLRESVRSDIVNETQGWFLLTEEMAYPIDRSLMIPDEEAERRIAAYQQTITRDRDGFVTFAQYAASRGE